MKVAILGSGAFGSALAITLAKTCETIFVWSKSKKLALELNKEMENRKYLPGVKFSKNIFISSDLQKTCVSSEAILICIPSQKIYSFFSKNHSVIPDVPLVICSKGIDSDYAMLQSEIIQKFLPNSKIAVMTGPSFASELGAGLPTALTLACKNKNIRDKLRNLLSSKSLRIYTSSDIIGTQLGGALKNVVAIACGMVKSANLGENARIAIMTRGFNEIITLGKAMGCDLKTFYGLSGLGDLTLTCNSMLSRNFMFGLNFKNDSLADKKQTIEGIKTAKAALKLMNQYGIEAPIINSVHLILNEKISLSKAMHELISRPLKDEF